MNHHIEIRIPVPSPPRLAELRNPEIVAYEVTKALTANGREVLDWDPLPAKFSVINGILNLVIPMQPGGWMSCPLCAGAGRIPPETDA